MGHVIDVKNYRCLTCTKCLISCDKDTMRVCSKFKKNKKSTDKKITVMLNTYRRSDAYLSEAIESFQRQSFKDAVLQITNTHPTPLKLDKEYDNIVIYNIRDAFGQYPRQAVWSLFRIKTPYWTILDDDDIIMPSYLEEFNGVIDKHPDKYIQIIRKKRLFVDGGKVKKIECGGWGGRLLSRFKYSDFELALKRSPFNSYQGVDNYLTSRVHTGKRIEVRLPPTYITRRQDDVAHIYKRKDNSVKVVRQRIGDSKQKVYAEKRLEILSPYWEKDYTKEYC